MRRGVGLCPKEMIRRLAPMLFIGEAENEAEGVRFELKRSASKCDLFLYSHRGGVKEVAPRAADRTHRNHSIRGKLA